MIKRGKVLVIEDDISWQTKLKKYLEKEGFFVDAAVSLEEAKVKMQNNYHYITIDLQLDTKTTDKEKFEGWEILQKVVNTSLKFRTPTMVVTGFDKEYLEVKGIKGLCSFNFMSKSKFDKRIFVKKIIDAVDKIDLTFKDDKRDHQVKK